MGGVPPVSPPQPAQVTLSQLVLCSDTQCPDHTDPGFALQRAQKPLSPERQVLRGLRTTSGCWHMVGCHPGSQFPSGFSSVDLCLAPGLPRSLGQAPVFRGLFPACEVGLGSAGVGGRCDQLCPRPPQASPVPLPALLPHGRRPRGDSVRPAGAAGAAGQPAG